MPAVPVVRIGNTLIASVQEDLSDRDALDLQTNLGLMLEKGAVQGVLLDLSVTEIVDSFLARVLNEIATTVRLLGAHTVVVGIRPAVAVTLVELGLTLKGFRTALSADKGLEVLRQLIAGKTG